MQTVTQEQFGLLINGKIVTSEAGGYFDSLNPSTGEVFARVADGTKKDMLNAIGSARQAFDKGEWSGLSIKERGHYLRKIVHLIREHAKVLADLESMDTGKTIKQSTFIDVPTSADTFEYFAGTAGQLKGNINPVSAPVRSLTAREPIGVIGCLIPWNYPLIMMAWKIAPALMAGNTIVFKPSPLASVSIMKWAQLLEQADLPPGVINIVSSSQNAVSTELVKHKDVGMISFSGSNQTGQEVMRQASATTKKIILELGGKSPNIVFEDCDFDSALGGTMAAIFMNQGQMCAAGSRLLLDEKIYDKFMEHLIERTGRLRIGPSMSYETDFGPLISREHRDKVLQFIQRGIKEGARLVYGGKVPVGLEEYSDKKIADGFYLEPTIFADVDNQMTIAQEEIFGPVLSVIKFSGKEDAVRLANDSPYGLASCIWTRDLHKANFISKQLHCGTVWINTYGGFYNEAPFGGYKQSGFGRELGSDGLLEYTQSKHICYDMTPSGHPLVASWF